MEKSIRLSTGVFGRTWGRIQAAVERKVDSWFVEDEREIQAYLEGCIRIMAIVACIGAIVYILIPAFLVLGGLWK